jgi:hypothetical protein
MCDNIEIVQGGNAEIEKLPSKSSKKELIRKKPSYFDKMVWMKANYKSLTKDCVEIAANWPSFGVASVHIGLVKNSPRQTSAEAE